MGFVWVLGRADVHADSFLHRVASPFRSFVASCMGFLGAHFFCFCAFLEVSSPRLYTMQICTLTLLYYFRSTYIFVWAFRWSVHYGESTSGRYE